MTKISQQKNVQLVKKLYGAFQKGNIQFILDALAEDVDWELVGPVDVPYAGKRSGRAQVLEFFKVIDRTAEYEEFLPKEFIAQGNKVVVLGHERGRIKSTGRTFENDWMMLFILRGGKIVRHICYEDTGKMLTALHAA